MAVSFYHCGFADENRGENAKNEGKNKNQEFTAALMLNKYKFEALVVIERKT